MIIVNYVLTSQTIVTFTMAYLAMITVNCDLTELFIFIHM